MPGQVEPSPYLLHQLRRHAATLRRRVEPDAPQPVAQRRGDAQCFLRLVLERVDERDAWHVRVDMPVEGFERAHGVAEDEDERVRHRAGRGQARQARARRRRRTDAAAHDAGVVHLVRHAGVNVTRAEADHRDRCRGIHDPACGGGPAGAAGQDAEDRGLVQAIGAVAGGDAHHHLLRREAVAVVQRLDDRLRIVSPLPAQDLAQVAERLLRAAQDPGGAREDLHRRHRVELLGGQDRVRPLEIDVGGLAGQHVRCGLEARPRGGLTHLRRRVVDGHGARV